MRSKATARKSVGSYAPELPPQMVEPVADVEEVVEEDDAFANEDADSSESNRGSDGEDDIEEEHDEEDHVECEENAGHVLASHFGSITNEESDESGDDCWKEDGIPDPISDEEDEEGIPKSPESEDRNVVEEDLQLGKFYPSKTDFKKALLRYSLKSGYDIKLYISNAKKLGAICSKKEAACPWRVYCSHEKQKQKLHIKVYEPHHTCIRSGYSKLLTSSTIAELFEDRLRHNPKFKPVEMADEIKNTYNLIVSVDQCRKAKTKLSKARRKVHEEQFAKIWDYEAELHKTNPGSTIDIETIPGAHPGSKQRFYRMYICFASQKTAWTNFCRPIIGLDGAFLKWDIKGQLIAAVGRDGDNRIVPIAWAVVEIENDTNWYWFLTHLKRDLGLLDGQNFTVISDKQKVNGYLSI